MNISLYKIQYNITDQTRCYTRTYIGYTYSICGVPSTVYKHASKVYVATIKYAMTIILRPRHTNF